VSQLKMYDSVRLMYFVSFSDAASSAAAVAKPADIKEVADRGSGERPRKTDSLPSARPIHVEDSETFMTVRFKNYRISVLLDTGSDVTLVNRQVARKYK